MYFQLVSVSESHGDHFSLFVLSKQTNKHIHVEDLRPSRRPSMGSLTMPTLSEMLDVMEKETFSG